MQHLYRHFDKNGKLLYVGVSLSTIQRLSQHKIASHWFKDIANVTIEHYETREAVLEAESKAIAEEKPLHNLMRPGCIKLDIFEELTNFDESKRELTKRVVNFNPLYSIADISRILDMQPSSIKRMIENKEIGSIVINENSGRWGPRKTIRVTGWQLIDFIENAESETAARKHKKQRSSKKQIA